MVISIPAGLPRLSSCDIATCGGDGIAGPQPEPDWSGRHLRLRRGLLRLRPAPSRNHLAGSIGRSGAAQMMAVRKCAHFIFPGLTARVGVLLVEENLETY